MAADADDEGVDQPVHIHEAPGGDADEGDDEQAPPVPEELTAEQKRKEGNS